MEYCDKEDVNVLKLTEHVLQSIWRNPIDWDTRLGLALKKFPRIF